MLGRLGLGLGLGLIGLKLSSDLPEFPVVRWDRSRTIEQKCSSSNLPLELVVFFH